MIPHLKLFLVLILFSQQWHCQRTIERIHCGSSYPRPHVKHKNICVQVNKTGPCEMWDTDMYVIDHSKVDVTFKVTSRNCSLYKFQLKVNDSMDEMDCVNTSKRYITDIHSEMRVNLEAKPVSHCEGMVNITFEDIPTGCYKLYYCTLRSESSEICGQLVKYLNTDIKVNHGMIKFEPPNLTPQPFIESNEVGITISKYTRFDEIQLTVRPDNTLNCTSVNDNRRTVWIARDVNGRLMCRRSSCYSPKMIQNENCSKIECYEELKNNAIKCEFKDISPGNYCVHMHITDPYCNRKMNDCTSHQKFRMNETILQSASVADPTMPVAYIVLTVVVGCLLFTSFIIIVFIYRRRWNKPQQVVVADDDHSWLQNPEILLLYPRDCKAFMNMMATCREIIAERTHCKVFDCFDPHHSEDISLNKMDWIRRHVLRQNVKVIVVETACAALHQRALIQNSRLIYNDPTWLDGLFLFGLKLLTDNMDRNNYQRVFVICVDGFTGEGDSLDYLTPYTRYVLPRYLDLLLADLNIQNFQNNVVRMTDDDSENLQRFEHDLKNLINYRGQNPEYLQQLLSIA